MTRNINKAWKSKPTIEGAGVHLKRAFGYHQVPDLDPFLLLNDFNSANPNDYLAGFPWHPTAASKLLLICFKDSGTWDSMGNKGIISPGDVQ